MADSGFWLRAGRRRLRRGSRRGPGSEENWAQRAVSAREGDEKGPSHRPGKGQPSPPQRRELPRHVLLQPPLHVHGRSMVWAHQTACTPPGPEPGAPQPSTRPTSPGSRPACGHSSHFPIWITSSQEASFSSEL